MNSVRSLLRNPYIKNAVRRAYHDKDASFKPVTMNDLPIPQGSWKTNYDSNQTKYNMHLLVGIAFATITLVTAKATGLVYLNWAPPKHPE